MQPSRLAFPLGLLLALGSSLALAAPGYDHPHHPGPRHYAPPPPKPALQPSWKQQATPAPQPQPQQQHSPRPGQHPAIQSAPPPVKHARPGYHAPQPPADFRPVRVQIHANRHHIGRGPALPPHVHIVRGKPLPPGWGRRLNAHQHRYVPHYHGYEWRRTGSDLVLVALATGIVYEILHDVLR